MADYRRGEEKEAKTRKTIRRGAETMQKPDGRRGKRCDIPTGDAESDVTFRRSAESDVSFRRETREET